MNTSLPKGSPVTLERARNLAVRALKWAVVKQMSLIELLGGAGNSTVENDPRYDRSEADRYSRPQGNR